MTTFTKEEVIDYLASIGKLDNRLLLAVTKSGSRLTNLHVETSDFDFKVFYLPSKRDLYFTHRKQSHNYKTEKEGLDVEINMIDIRFYIQMLRKSNIPSLTYLYDDSDVIVESRAEFYACEKYTRVFKSLQQYREIVGFIDPKKFFASTKGMLMQYKRSFEKGDNFAKYYMNYKWTFDILQAAKDHMYLHPYIITDGSLTSLRNTDSEEDFAIYQQNIAVMEETLSNNSIYDSFVNGTFNDAVLVTWENYLMEQLFSQDLREG